MLRRLAALIAKELTQTLRDRATLVIVLSIPVIELFLFAYAVDLTVDNIPTAVADLSLDRQSVALVDALAISRFFDVTHHLPDEAAIIHAIDAGQVRAGVVIPPNFAAEVERGTAQVLVLLDGSDSFTVQSGYSAAGAIAQQRALELLAQKAGRMGASLNTTTISTSTRVLFNPTLDDMIFIVPAMAGILLQLLTVNLTAVAVVRERELGTIEQLLATPTRPLELMVAKMVPNVLVTSFGLATVTLLGVYWFGVPFRGDPWLYAWLSLLFLVSGLGLGLLISTITHNQRQAQQVTTLLMLLGLLLTGFIYPRAPMPPAVRAVSNFIPLTYYIRIVRGVFTKGLDISFLWNDVVVLLVYGGVAMATAAATFKKRLD